MCSSDLLKNICQRLKLFYGEQAELVIRSEEHQGTTVTIHIPVSSHPPKTDAAVPDPDKDHDKSHLHPTHNMEVSHVQYPDRR